MKIRVFLNILKSDSVTDIWIEQLCDKIQFSLFQMTKVVHFEWLVVRVAVFCLHERLIARQDLDHDTALGPHVRILPWFLRIPNLRWLLSLGPHISVAAVLAILGNRAQRLQNLLGHLHVLPAGQEFLVQPFVVHLDAAEVEQVEFALVG